MRYYQAMKRDEVTDICYSVDEPWKHNAEQKKSGTKGHILYDSICRFHLYEMSGTGKSVGTRVDEWPSGLGERESG